MRLLALVALVVGLCLAASLRPGTAPVQADQPTRLPEAWRFLTTEQQLPAAAKTLPPYAVDVIIRRAAQALAKYEPPRTDEEQQELAGYLGTSTLDLARHLRGRKFSIPPEELDHLTAECFGAQLAWRIDFGLRSWSTRHERPHGLVEAMARMASELAAVIPEEAGLSPAQRIEIAGYLRSVLDEISRNPFMPFLKTPITEEHRRAFVDNSVFGHWPSGEEPLSEVWRTNRKKAQENLREQLYLHAFAFRAENEPQEIEDLWQRMEPLSRKRFADAIEAWRQQDLAREVRERYEGSIVNLLDIADMPDVVFGFVPQAFGDPIAAAGQLVFDCWDRDEPLCRVRCSVWQKPPDAYRWTLMGVESPGGWWSPRHMRRVGASYIRGGGRYTVYLAKTGAGRSRAWSELPERLPVVKGWLADNDLPDLGAVHAGAAAAAQALKSVLSEWERGAGPAKIELERPCEIEPGVLVKAFLRQPPPAGYLLTVEGLGQDGQRTIAFSVRQEDDSRIVELETAGGAIAVGGEVTTALRLPRYDPAAGTFKMGQEEPVYLETTVNVPEKTARYVFRQHRGAWLVSSARAEGPDRSLSLRARAEGPTGEFEVILYPRPGTVGKPRTLRVVSGQGPRVTLFEYTAQWDVGAHVPDELFTIH